MADNTKIEWADATLNYANGCSVLSPGCTNCYAMKQAHRFPVRQGLTVKTKGGMVWTGEVRINEKALHQALAWRRGRRIFWNAHGDLFHEKVTDAQIDRLFAVCALTPQHTHMILTKRSARMREWFERRMKNPGYETFAHARDFVGDQMFNDHREGHPLIWPLPNVWLGVSVEDQARADERIPDLLATPAAVRFISAEPLLGPVDLDEVAPNGDGACRALYECPAEESVDDDFIPKLDWVIAGGESGPGARPMHPDWARALRDQCAAANVPFFFKQWGEWGVDAGPLGTRDRDGFPRDPVMEGLGPCRVLVDGAWQEFADGYAVPLELCKGHGEHVYRWGKKRAGRLLDGVTHDGFPT